MSTYLVSERFKSIQGEGVFTGTPMAFIRFVGCSVGKKTCNACDTDFEAIHNFRGGGEYTALDLLLWAARPTCFQHVCLTGGEPFDQDLVPLLRENEWADKFHIETSGTVFATIDPHLWDFRDRLWICVSPKPGYQEGMIEEANEVKVIVPGLGSGPGWPTVQDAIRWADHGKIVFLQPRNLRSEVDRTNLTLCQELVQEHPQLKLSVQLHKLLSVR